jgi:hypothetical protein
LSIKRNEKEKERKRKKIGVGNSLCRQEEYELSYSRKNYKQ